MSGQEATETTETVPGESTETDETSQKPTETVEFWREKAREQEKRAKANAAAAKRLEELEAANKSDLEKATEQAAKAAEEAADARAEALRLRIAVEHGIGVEDADLFLTGRDEETLRAQAKRLADREADRKKHGARVPAEGGSPGGKSDDLRDFTRQLFKSST